MARRKEDRRTLSDEELRRRLGLARGPMAAAGREGEEEPSGEGPSSLLEDYAPGAGLGLGYVRLEGARDRAELVCRLCGRPLGAEAWAEALSNGAGGVYWSAPICDRCRGR